ENAGRAERLIGQRAGGRPLPAGGVKDAVNARRVAAHARRTVRVAGGGRMRQEYSFTKRNVLDTCARAYFYEYFAANDKVEFDAGRKARIKEAKKLSSVHLLAGIWLHQFIRRFLYSYPNVPADLEDECCAIFDNAVSRSRSPARRRNSQGLLLLEYVFDDPEADERAASSRETLIRAIRHFRETPEVREVWEDVLRGEPWIEKAIGGLPKVDGYGIRGQIDFAVRHAQRVRIVDWKSG